MSALCDQWVGIGTTLRHMDYYRLLLVAVVREGGEDVISAATESSPLLQGSWQWGGVTDNERLEKLTNTLSLSAAPAITIGGHVGSSWIADSIGGKAVH